MKGSEINTLAREGVFQGKRLNAKVEETHVSWIILTPSVVFKIKKPLKLSFLDFSTLSRRKKYCEKELILNRRYSDIYQAVVPVTYNKGRWFLGSGGKIADYAVQMKRMISARRMDLMLEHGKVDKGYILSLARLIASFHRKSQIKYSRFTSGFARQLFNDIKGVRAFVLKVLGKEYASVISTSIAGSNTFLQGHAPRFRERLQKGYKRDVHGDLHSGNVFLYKRPVIFDCIEFNDEYRQIDVMSEVAFLCMDLEAFGRTDMATAFLEEYKIAFPCFETPEDDEIFIYYKCYRANIRAKVHLIASAQEEIDTAGYKEHMRFAKRYLSLMKRYIAQIT